MNSSSLDMVKEAFFFVRRQLWVLIQGMPGSGRVVRQIRSVPGRALPPRAGLLRAVYALLETSVPGLLSGD